MAGLGDTIRAADGKTEAADLIEAVGQRER